MGSNMDNKKQHTDQHDGDDSKYKSKNLKAERKRRKKLNDRQLELRALVPIITNMTKATIVTDAIAYIEELKMSVEELSNQLLQMEATSVDQEKTKLKEVEVETEVEVKHICGTKIWIRMVFQKKRGAITKLLEAISLLGSDLNDTAITTSGGALLFTSLAQGTHGGLPEADQMKKYLLEIIRTI